MIQSMTGFGEARLEENGHAYHVDIRSVNNRYFKTTIRLPEDFAFMELELDQLIRKRMTRGSLTVKVYTRDLSAAAAQEINQAAVQHYLAQFKAVMGEPHYSVDLATLAMLPGVCQPHEFTERERERCWEIVAKLTDEALDQLVKMRASEGRALAADLQARCGEVRENALAIRTLVPRVIEEYRQRLTTRVRQLINDANVALAEQDLLKEVAIYAERSDISEELARLESHLDQFTSAMQSREPAGRKLEFIAQELLREANTIGSKAGDAEVARRTIEIKTAIDRIKEQVQNVE